MNVSERSGSVTPLVEGRELWQLLCQRACECQRQRRSMKARRTRGSAAGADRDKLKPVHSSRELERIIREDKGSSSQNASPLRPYAHAGERAPCAHPEEPSAAPMRTHPEGNLPPAAHLSLEPLLTSKTWELYSEIPTPWTTRWGDRAPPVVPAPSQLS